MSTPKDAPVAEVMSTSAEAPLAVIPTGTLTVAEQKAADTRYAEKVVFFRERDQKLLGTVLVSHWEKGKFVSDMLQRTRHWGNATAEQFAKDMSVSPEMVWAYQRLFERYTEEQIEQLVTQRIAWSNVYYLLSVKDQDKREALQNELASGKITPAVLQDKIKKINVQARTTASSRGRKADNRGGVTPATVIRSTTSLCVDMVRKLEDFKDAYKEYEKLEDGARKSDIATRLKDARKALKAVRDRVDAVLKLTEE